MSAHVDKDLLTDRVRIFNRNDQRANPTTITWPCRDKQKTIQVELKELLG